ncbi:MAG: hypothetical protein QXG52_03055 [Candidatus Caldarchaeum sp.]|uniref:Lycopene cyclase domain-containing protein n=1 Tax=Caldiarchaeum subterraneum TaxID=311458 RepID=A0A7C5Y967_CALS0
MACFLLPLTVAVLLSLAFVLSDEFRERIHLLNLLMWGCAIGLVADHVITGELVFHPPFLTGWNPAAGITSLVEEIVFTGGIITLSLTAFWSILTVAPKLTKAFVFQKIRPTQRDN